MAKNKVQFQKSMNIHAFIQRYGSEDLCQQRLLRIPVKMNTCSGQREHLFS